MGNPDLKSIRFNFHIAIVRASSDPAVFFQISPEPVRKDELRTPAFPTGRTSQLTITPAGRNRPYSLLANRPFNVSECGNLITITTRPILRINARSNPTVETRPFPVDRAPNVPMFHWIEVDVVEMAFKVVFVFDRVFPELRLPDATPPIGLSSRRDFAFRTARSKPPLSELCFDPLPSAGVIRIAPRHTPDRMKMIR